MKLEHVYPCKRRLAFYLDSVIHRDHGYVCLNEAQFSAYLLHSNGLVYVVNTIS